ncbi:MAG: carbohydrate-binding domain-containing protein, partial [Prevotella sp.]|nr:carbohydrate-binding domain-containing protein [Prevotella sp.]
MMKRLAYLIMILSAGIFFSCTTENEWDDYFSVDENINMGGNGGGMMPGGTASSGTALTTTLGTFDVTIDTSALTETETIPGSTDTYYEDYVETYTPTTTIKIAYNGNSATVSGEAEGVTITKDGADVTVNSTVKNIAYELSGTTSDGSFKIYSEKKFEVILNGVDITNPTGAAINNQGKRMYVVVKDGTTNKLTDGSSYTMVDNEDMKGTLFSEGKLAFSGSGTLSVYSNAKNGIVSDDYVFIRPNTNIYVKSTTNHGIKANDGVIIRGGVVNVEVSADAAKGINTDGFIQIEGGRVTAITSGGSSYDDEDKEYKGCAGIKSDSIFVISGGEVNVKSTGA